MFNGGSSHASRIGNTQPRLLAIGGDDATVSDNQSLTIVPAISNQGGRDEDDRVNERPRADEYEIALSATDDVPQTYAEAMSSPEATQWKNAVRADLRSHLKNHTWDLVRRTPGMKVIESKWVFALKRDEHGTITRYKARLVAFGFLQTLGIDYSTMYSPVASLNAIRIFLAVYCHLGYWIKQYDVETAFLNDNFEKDVYMAIPKGVQDVGGRVCKLRRNIYGLKQAVAVWFKTIQQCSSRSSLSSAGRICSSTFVADAPGLFTSFSTLTTS